jgi:hypothetical protein
LFVATATQFKRQMMPGQEPPRALAGRGTKRVLVAFEYE